MVHRKTRNRDGLVEEDVGVVMPSVRKLQIQSLKGFYREDFLGGILGTQY